MRGLWQAALVLAWAAGCARGAPSQGPEPLPPADEVWLTAEQVAQAGLKIQEITIHDLMAPVLCAGKLSFDDERVVHVFAPVSGRITHIHAPLGTHVKKGDPLCGIQSVELAQAVAAERGAHADLRTAKRNYERARTLYEGHAAAQKDFEAAHAQYVQVQAEYERSHQKVVLLSGAKETGSGQYLLRAPLEGNIVASAAHPGAEVQGQYDAGSNVAELFVVGDLDQIWALADVFEMDVHQIDVGDRVEVDSIAYPTETFMAKVDWVSEAVDPETRAVRVRCRLDNPDHRLKPDMFVRMKILSDRPKGLTVPRTALFRVGGKTVAFVALPDGPKGEKRFGRRTVVAEETAFGDDVPVTFGLSEHERVVAAGGIILLGDG